MRRYPTIGKILDDLLAELDRAGILPVREAGNILIHVGPDGSRDLHCTRVLTDQNKSLDKKPRKVKMVPIG